MKQDAMGLLRNAAMSLKHRDPLMAFSLLELANHLRLLMRGEVTLAHWNDVYVGADREALDIDKLLPVSFDQ